MLSQYATITTKRQITIPSKVFKLAGFKEGQKVLVSCEGGELKVSSALKLVADLAKSVIVPQRYKNMDIDEMVQKAKKERLQKKI